MYVDFESYESAMEAVASTIYGSELKGGIRYALTINHNLIVDANMKVYNIRRKIEELEEDK